MVREYTVQILQGEGRNGLCDALNVVLMLARAVIRAGTYRITVERITRGTG